MLARRNSVFSFRSADDTRSVSLPERVCLAMVVFGGALLAAVLLSDVYFLK